MHLCYINESGTSEIPGTSNHFILAGLDIPIWHWNDCDRELRRIKQRYDLTNDEIHTAWLVRKYFEQKKVPDFEKLDYRQRASEVQRLRKAELFRLQRLNHKRYQQAKKNYRKTDSYIHLTFDERKSFILEVAKCVADWGYARLFAECIDKVYFDPSLAPNSIDEQSFEQIVSRYETYLRMISQNNDSKFFGLLIHDNNETVARKHTALMKKFHHVGTFWTEIKHIIETPFFVDSQLTGMVQIYLQES